MAKKFGFFNSINGDRKYLATDISEALDIGISTGLKADREDNFQIVPHENMTIKMLPGGAMIFGNYILDKEEELITLDLADGELNRIDRVVLRYDKYERSIKTVVIKGTPALTPTAPTPLRTQEQFDLVLADIYVSKATTTITESNITDMRNSELCGFIGVKGAVSQIDFDAHLAESAKKHIAESGSNANGSYIRFDDGTLICTHRANFTVAANGVIWVLPASFKYSDFFTMAIPTTRIEAGGDQSLGYFPPGPYGTNNTTQITYRAMKTYNSIIPNETEVNLRLFAIGRWK